MGNDGVRGQRANFFILDQAAKMETNWSEHSNRPYPSRSRLKKTKFSNTKRIKTIESATPEALSRLLSDLKHFPNLPDIS